MRSLHIFIFLLLGCIAYSQTDTKISAELKSAMLLANDHDIVVLMSEQAEIQTDHIQGKVAKAEYVHEILAAKAESSQVAVRNILNVRAVDYTTFNVVNAISLHADNHLIEILAAEPTVKRVLHDPWFKVEQSIASSKPSATNRMADTTYGVKMINVPALWDLGATGKGITVAGQDTGYDWDIDPLRSKYRGWNEVDSMADHNYHWHDAIHEISPLHGDSIISPDLNPCGLSALAPCDDNNHGTHTMGTMVGGTDEEVIGVAPDAKWIGCRSLERGWGKLSTYTECFDFFLAPTDLNGENPRPELAPHVINNSWYCPAEEGCTLDTWEIMEIVMANIKASGTMIVVSAGNSGPGCSTIIAPPAIFESAFTVGAVSSDSLIAPFSSRGPLGTDSVTIAPHVVAPGVDVRSVVRGGVFQNNSGTSMSGPHVAGVAALLFSGSPSLDGQVDIVQDGIMASAYQKQSIQDCSGLLGSEIPNAVYGYGIVDAYAAAELIYTALDTEEQTLHPTIKIYPNPTNGILNIKVTDANIDNIIITDIAGRVIKYISEINDNEVNLNLQQHSAGLYFYRVAAANQVFSGKISKL